MENGGRNPPPFSSVLSPTMRDPGETDEPYYISGVRSPRRSQAGGILYAALMGTFFTGWGLKLRFWPQGPMEWDFSKTLLIVGPLLILSALATFVLRRRRDRDGRWG